MLDLARPRIVLVTRKTRHQVMLERHGTAGQAQFYMVTRAAAAREQRAGPAARIMQAAPAAAAAPADMPENRVVEDAHARFMDALSFVQRSIPADQRQVRVDRDSLDRFVFEPEDLVLVVGQDGLVPNVAKYLRGQLCIGVNPDRALYEGVLVPHAPDDVPDLLVWAEHAVAALRTAQQDSGPEGASLEGLAEAHRGGFTVQQRVMAQALREDGQRLLALNEIFIGHRSHQSARYMLYASGMEERQSSSGILCCTGTGGSGWARSVAQMIGLDQPLPAPDERRLIWFVREPWQSVSTGASLSRGWVDDNLTLNAMSEMGEGGVIFADGIESDNLEFLEGQSVTVGIAEHRLNLVVRS
jgi:NAD kinase